MLNLLFTVIPGLFTTINGITTAISNERIKKIQAKTDEERIAADENIKTLEARRDVLLNAQDRSKLDIYGRSIIGYSVGFFLSKIFIWDKALGSWTGGHTDPLSPELGWVVSATVAFYLVTTTKMFNK